MTGVMEMRVVIAGREYRVRLDAARSLAIPLDFAGPQPSFFGAPRASAAPLRLPDFVGSTHEGGSCNVAELRLIPHCNGTHIETVGHIVNDRVALAHVVGASLFSGRLVTIAPSLAQDSAEGYGPTLDAGDRLVTRSALEVALHAVPREETQALIVRTLPNDASKARRVYEDTDPPPFFSTEAIGYLIDVGVEHLLVDFPSIDRMRDQGTLSNHRLFWNVPPSSRTLNGATGSRKTVTEMILVPDGIPDGLYLLDIAVPAFLSDAAPCRPVIYPLVLLAPAG
jgi:kynurenine formamidase